MGCLSDMLIVNINNTGIIISFLTLVAMVLASRYVYLTKGLLIKIKSEGVHGVFSARFKDTEGVSDADDEGGRR